MRVESIYDSTLFSGLTSSQKYLLQGEFMIRKFFVQIIIISIVVMFFGLNFDTKVDIKFWFNDKLTVEGISLFIALAISFLLGVITIIPLYIKRLFAERKRKKQILESDE